jgi:hypothetical protein
MFRGRYYEELLAKTAAELAQSSCQDDQLSHDERAEVEQVGQDACMLGMLFVCVYQYMHWWYGSRGELSFSH